MREPAEQIGKGLRVFNHWEMAAGYLDRLDPEQLVRHESLPGRIEDLIVGRVDEFGRNVRMACTGDFPDAACTARRRKGDRMGPLRGRAGSRSPARRLTTVFFIDIVGSTEQAVALGDRRWRELLGAYHGLISKQLKRFGGREVDRAGDGVFATFREPAKAVACASSIVEAVGRLSLRVRVGIHTGEAEVSGSGVGGIAVHVGARITSAAGPGEILVSSVVHDLMAGSDIRFEDRGHHELKGVPGQSRLFSVQTRSTTEAPEEPLPIPSELAATGNRPRNRRIVIPVLALAVAATTAVVVFLVGGSASTHHAGVPHTAGLIGFKAPDNSVVQIDPSSHRAKTTVTGLVPVSPAFPAHQIEVGEGGVWVDTGSTIQHIDPRRRAVVAQIHAQSAMSTIAVGQGAIWAGGNLGITRTSPATDKLEATIPFDTGAEQPTKIAVAGGDVWLLVSDGRLLRIDAGTNRISRRLQAGTTGWDLAVTPHALWILDLGGGQVVEVDSDSARVLRRIAVGGNLARIVVGSGKLWVLDTAAGVVTPIDPASGAAQSPIRVGRGPVDMVYGLGAVWVANRADGSITRIDPQLLKTTTIGAPRSIAAIAVDPATKTLWAYLSQRGGA